MISLSNINLFILSKINTVRQYDITYFIDKLHDYGRLSMEHSSAMMQMS